MISFSGDKLLGGPQAGILAGKREIVSRLRRNPMFRALRVDKTIYEILEATLRDLLLARWDHIPALRMIRLTAEQIKSRAEALVEKLPVLRAEVIAGSSVTGGGATPAQELPTYLVAIEAPDLNVLENRLRAGNPPVIARIADDRLLVDLRTVAPDEEPLLCASAYGSRALKCQTAWTACFS